MTVNRPKEDDIAQQPGYQPPYYPLLSSGPISGAGTTLATIAFASIFLIIALGAVAKKHG